MIEQTIFIDKSFDIDNINNYHLSLQVNLKGFSFCILDRNKNKFIGLGNYYFSKITSYNILLEELEQIFKNEPVLNYGYHHIKLIFFTPKYTYIPSSFFDPAHIKTTFSFNQSLNTNSEVISNFIYGNSSYVVYEIPSFIKSFFETKFGSIKIYHHSCPLIEELLLKDKLSLQKSKVTLNILPDIFDLAYMDDGELKLYNTFAFTSQSDFNYFVLNTFNQLGLSTLMTPLTIMGTIDRDDPKIDQLKKYIKQINFALKPSHFEYAYGFNDIPDHQFINLINLYQCG